MLKCIGLTRQIDYIDRRHCGLLQVPDEIYRHERTLEELLLDYNNIQELPPKFFRLTNLRRLTLSENDLIRIPPGIANLIHLLELDISKNAIEDVPQNLQFCKSLAVLDLSSNPLIRAPEALSSVASLTQLCLNDVAIPNLPYEIGRLENLAVLEARENILKELPESIGALRKLKRLDVGNNEIEYLPSVIGNLEQLTELWLDCNVLSLLPDEFCKLVNLTVLDVTKNKLERLPDGFTNLSLLSDFHASENCLYELPQELGELRRLTLLKLDLNQLTEIPESIGRLQLVTELLLFDNMLDSIPPSLFEMSSLEMLNLDRNHLTELPPTVGKCKTLHVLSLRENELVRLPEELEELSELTVLDVVGNRLRYLPIGLTSLKLDALWIDGSQTQPLIALHPEQDPENPEKKRLTCVFLPQKDNYSPSLENFLEDSESYREEPTSAVGSLSRGNSLGRGGRLGVAFDPSVGPSDIDDHPRRIVRFPTPFRKDMKALKAKRKKGARFKPDATPSTTIFKKGSSQDDLTIFSTSLDSKGDSALGDFNEIVDQYGRSPRHNGEPEGPLALKVMEPDEEMETGEPGSQLGKMAVVGDLTERQREGTGMDLVQGTPTSAGQMQDSTPDLLKNAVYSFDQSDVVGKSELQTIEVVIELEKLPGRSLGFSIAGGRGSTPAYEDVDESIFVTKIAPGGLAEQDERLRLGDKLLSVNDKDMTDATHAEAVALLKSITDACRVVVSREVLVVMDQTQIEDVASPTTLPTPKTKLTFERGSSDRETTSPEVEPSPFAPLQRREEEEEREEVQEGAEGEGEGEGEGESFAKKIVAEILGKSVTRVEKEGNAGEEGDKEGEGDVTSPREDYVNYDIAQNVIESTARDGSRSPSLAEDEESPLPVKKEQEAGFLEPEKPSHSKVREPSPSVESTYSMGDFPEEHVKLDRSIGLLGLSIVGGADHSSKVFGRGKPGVYVSKITKGGAAHATGRLKLGDRILDVNGHNMRRATHQEAVQMLVSQRGDIELLIQHIPQPPGLQEIVIEKDTNEKLGISIRGGAKGSKGNPLDSDDEGIFISKITKGGAAERESRLKVGERLLEVNGTSLLGVSHLEAVKALRSAPSTFTVIICHGYDPREVVWRKARASLATPLDEASRLLSESMDTLPHRTRSSVAAAYFRTAPPMATFPRMKHSHSSDLMKGKPVSTEELDRVLKDLAKFKDMSTIRSKPEPELVTSTPVPADEPPRTVSLKDVFGTEELFPLQNGGLGLSLGGEDVPDIPPFVEDRHQEAPVRVDEEVGGPSLEEEQELSRVQGEDASSLLAALDRRVSLIQDDVSKQEVELLEEEKKPKAVPKRQSRRSQPQAQGSPTIQIKIDAPDVPEDAPPANVEAIQSMMGEVFDLSFDEFEEESIPSGPPSGYLTPIYQSLRAMSPDPNPPGNLDELLTALQGLGESEKSKEKEEVDSSAVDRKAHVELAAPVPVVSVRAEPKETAPRSSLGVAPRGSPVLLRASTGRKDHEKRKSAPPAVAESESGPERLSFKEKLAMYRKVSDGPSPPLVRPSSADKQKRHLAGTSAVLAMKRTASDGATVPRGSAEIASQDDHRKVEDTTTSEPEFPDPTIADTFSPEALVVSSVDYPEDGSSVDRPNLNNSSNVTSSPADTESKTAEVSPYVARVLANMPTPVEPPRDDDSTKHENPEEWARRRAWREEQSVELEREVQRVEDILQEAKEAQREGGHSRQTDEGK